MIAPKGGGRPPPSSAHEAKAFPSFSFFRLTTLLYPLHFGRMQFRFDLVFPLKDLPAFIMAGLTSTLAWSDPRLSVPPICPALCHCLIRLSTL